MGDEEDGDAEYTIHRSTRRKRPRDEWSSEIVMKVRQSRTSGDSETIAVKSRGGKPSWENDITSIYIRVNTPPGCSRYP